MKKEKRLSAAVLAGFLLAGCILSGCASDRGESVQNAEADTQNTQNTQNEAYEDEDALIVTYLYMKEVPGDLDEVEAAMNKITEGKAELHITLKAVNLDYEMQGGYSVMIGQNSPMDVICFAYVDIAPMIQSGQLLGLNSELAENGNSISELAEKFPLYTGAVKDGEIYAVSQVFGMYCNQNCVVIKDSALDGCSYTEKDVYSMEDLTEIFRQIREKNPDVYPLAFESSDLASNPGISKSFMCYSAMAGSTMSGVLMSTDSTRIVNLYDTEEYRAFLKQMREWYEAGYILPDTATCDTDTNVLMRQEIACAEVTSFWADNEEIALETFGTTATAFPVSERYYDARNNAEAIRWAIYAGTKDADASMRFMNLLYSDEELANLLAYGIEGRNYTWNEDHTRIRQTEDSGYVRNYRFAPNDQIRYTMEGDEDWRDWEEWTEESLSNSFVSLGYTFDDTDMLKTMDELEQIGSRYIPLLECGMCENWEELYERMRKELHDAGIDEVIAENQRQLDAWQAAQN